MSQSIWYIIELNIQIFGLLHHLNKYIALLMGNQICCEDSRTIPGELQEMEANQIHKNGNLLNFQSNNAPPQSRVDIHVSSETVPEPTKAPQLKGAVKATLQKYNFLQKEYSNCSKHLKGYGLDIYEGDLDSSTKKPNGFGRMYKVDGSLFIGHFLNGRAHGVGAYIFADGSFYSGEFVKNQAECQKGQFVSDSLSYVGGFRNNTFHGKGTENGKNYQFSGTYEEGHKDKGEMKWKEGKEELVYFGTFNSHNKFHGKGILTEAKGTYDGFFLNGVKQGEGFYKGKNGIKYKGEYKNGERNGKGIIYNNDDSIAYQGELSNGLPHGKGLIYKNGEKVETEWRHGIDSSVIDE